MATFPTLVPSSRTFGPGSYPHSVLTGMSGATSRVRNSNAMLDSQLRLTFLAITEAQMLLILNHYRAQQGAFRRFSLPTSCWSGASAAADYQLTGYGWVYASSPTVSDAMCADAYDVELTLTSVPPEGVTVAGARLTVTASVSYGFAIALGFSQSVTFTLGAGAATGENNQPGLSQTVAWSLAAGQGTAGAYQGAALTVACSLAGGVASSSSTDPSFSSVSLLLHMDGSNGSTTFTDKSSNAHSITVDAGTVNITTADSKFGGASGNFATGGRLKTPTSATFTLNADFTIEFWAKRTGTTGIFDTLLSASSENALMIRASSTNPQINFNGSSFATSISLTLNVWHHIALVRSGSTVTAYKDGTSIGTLTSSATVTCNFLLIGDSSVSGRYFKGYMDELRVTKGVARYTANFTPATESFPDA